MRDHIREQAEYFSNIPLIERGVRASVHLEARADVLFWDTLLQRYRPGKYNYIYYSRSRYGDRTSGVSQCLQYRPYLSKRFFICIDSDLRPFYSPSSCKVSHFILQTYCYSWENHYCWAKGLQQRFQKRFLRASEQFDFENFLLQLSRLLYKPFLQLLYAPEEMQPTLHQIGQCIPMQQKKHTLYGGAKAFLARVRRNLSQLPGAEDPIPQSYYDKAAACGLTPENTYLHFRGHNIYDLVCHIGMVMSKCTHSQFEDEDLLKSCPDADYAQLQRIKQDMEEL